MEELFMIRFECDYAEGAHPLILQKLCDTNMEQTPGYGVDIHCETARKHIRDACLSPDADIHFLVGGTQTNATVISSILRPHQGVICASTGHINVHESGAIEASGHKVLSLPGEDGKITAQQIEDLILGHFHDENFEHMVQPGMVYLSWPTENGTIYSKNELLAINSVCRRCRIPLYIDGARMGYGLMSDSCDLTLPDFATLADIFYIGGTKVGAMFGEAVVITDPDLKTDFRYLIKQNGGMLAKGRLLGIQFETLFEDGLYCRIARHAVTQAMRIRQAFQHKGIPLLYDSYTNQQYPILNQIQIDQLSRRYSFCFWERVDEKRSAVRFCTSWATSETDVDQLLSDIGHL